MYLALIDHNPKHASSFLNLDILDVYLPALSKADCLIQTVIQLWKCRVALLMTKCMHVGMHIGIEIPISLKISVVGER